MVKVFNQDTLAIKLTKDMLGFEISNYSDPPKVSQDGSPGSVVSFLSEETEQKKSFFQHPVRQGTIVDLRIPEQEEEGLSLKKLINMHSQDSERSIGDQQSDNWQPHKFSFIISTYDLNDEENTLLIYFKMIEHMQTM